MSLFFHPLLTLIVSATDWELAKYIQFLNEEYKILRARVPGVIHTRPDERERLIKFGKTLGRAIEVLLTEEFAKSVMNGRGKRCGQLAENEK